jgi:hypothetical protein
MYDPHVKEFQMEVIDLEGKSQIFQTLEEANQHRKQLHAAMQDFPQKPIFLSIRDPDPSAVNVTFLNFPGFIAMGEAGDEGDRLLRQIDKSISEMVEIK